ncbi:MAG: alpha/beta fold hydrolase [Actinophytocola sp.]|nr:alpha/beta fold hydrolase [Actinophytocola sp.]
MSSTHIDGVDLYVEERGNGHPVLLIHGNGATAGQWGTTADDLARSSRVISYDRRGFGRSVHAPVKDFRRHTADAAALLLALNAAPATVVGWSGGGLVALDLAISHPQLVASLVLEEPPLHAKRHMTMTMARAMLKAQLLRRLRGAEVGADVFFRWASRYTTGGSAFDRFPPAWQATLRANGAATMAELDAGTGEYLSRKQISAINCPVTCLVGDLSDPALVAATRRIAALLPHARVVEATGAGHALHFDRPDLFVDTITAAIPQVG